MKKIPENHGDHRGGLGWLMAVFGVIKFPSWDPGEGTKLENERLLNHKVIGWKMYR